MEKEEYEKLEALRGDIAKLTADRDVFKKVIEAHQRQDIERVREILGKLKLLPHCVEICWFLCWIEYRVRCVKICRMLCR